MVRKSEQDKSMTKSQVGIKSSNENIYQQWKIFNDFGAAVGFSLLSWIWKDAMNVTDGFDMEDDIGL